MNKTLFDRAVDRDSPNPNSYVKTAFDEILGAIYSTVISEEEDNKLIEDMAYYAMEKLGIEEENFNWQTIEEFQYREAYSLATWYFSFPEVIKIITKAKVSNNYEWEDIKSSAIPLEEINKKILSDFKVNLDEYISVYSIEDAKKGYEE